MNSSKFKELKITHRFLSESGLQVPQELLLTLSGMITEEEHRRQRRRIERMSDDELAALDNKSCHSIKVTTPEGLLIRSRTNMQTFRYVLEHIGLDRVNVLQVKVGRHPVVVVAPARKRLKGYIAVRPGYFVLKENASDTIASVLRQIDRMLRLNLEIELV